MARAICSLEIRGRLKAGALFLLLSSGLVIAQTSAPTPPSALSANAVSCGEVALAWNPALDNSGTGLKAYSIWRSDSGVNTLTSIGAARTWFNDTVRVKSATTMSYYVVAVDNVGNQSVPGNTVAVSTPACPLEAGEQIVDDAYIGPLGKSMASFGTRDAVLYQKLNAFSQPETWIYLYDSDGAPIPPFRLHAYPGYSQRENDYLFTSATELWTLSYDAAGGHVLASQYQLAGSPPSSAVLVSSTPLGDSNSVGASLIRLQSGALLAAWTEQGANALDLTTGFAYRSPTGAWKSHFPLTIPNGGLGGNVILTKMAMAQHPADGSIWAFLKRDSYANITALHFTEGGGDVNLDAITLSYISQNADGINGPEGEFPYLTASPDPTRNAILLAYQDYQYQFVFIDPLYGSMSNNIFLKQARVSIAQIAADGTKSYIPFQNYTERTTQFGMSVLPDGTIWLAYQPINSQTFTWNAVYASSYQNGVWADPVFAGLDYAGYNQASGLPISLVYRADQPFIAFVTPDQQIHTFDLSNASPAPADNTAPITAIASPASGSALTGVVNVTASAADNVAVSKVDLLMDGVITATLVSSPYTLPWDTTKYPNGTHTLQSKAYDSAGNVGLSATISVNVNNQLSPANLKVAITSPINGSTVSRNQRVTINATASDTVAVYKVEFYVNNNLLGTASAAPFSYSWKVPGKRGQYSIKAKGYDAIGNNATQVVNVTAQ